MDTQKNTVISLEAIPANRRLLDGLSSHRLISAAAWEYALELLYPSKNWGLWVSRLLLTLGVSLVLSGIVYFFAFNWAKLTPLTKFTALQASIALCLGAAYVYGLQRLSGRILLLCAAVLVGVFLAVFGQVYQTGADAYTLFMFWALLILPWTAIAEFAALWAVWLAVGNIFLALFWDQAVQSDSDSDLLLFSYLALFNGLFLALREYVATRGSVWLQARWTRVILIIPILIYLLVPTIEFITDLEDATAAMSSGALLSGVVHIAFYIVYRFKLPDLWALSTTLLSLCIIIETAIFKVLIDYFKYSDEVFFLLMGVVTLGVFLAAIIKLRGIAAALEVGNV